MIRTAVWIFVISMSVFQLGPVFAGAVDETEPPGFRSFILINDEEIDPKSVPVPEKTRVLSHDNLEMEHQKSQMLPTRAQRNRMFNQWGVVELVGELDELDRDRLFMSLVSRSPAGVHEQFPIITIEKAKQIRDDVDQLLKSKR